MLLFPYTVYDCLSYMEQKVSACNFLSSTLYRYPWLTNKQISLNPYSTIFYLVGALNWSILVFVRLAGKGVGALDARYGVRDGMGAENDEKYSAANCTTSSGFLSNRNWRKSAKRFLSSGCARMYVVWSPFNSSWRVKNKSLHLQACTSGIITICVQACTSIPILNVRVQA